MITEKKTFTGTIQVNHPILGKAVNHMRVRGDFLGKIARVAHNDLVAQKYEMV